MADLGLYSLRLALFLSALGIGVGIFAGLTRRDDWSRVAERSVLLVCAGVSVAMGALFYSLATNDFSLAYVAQNSARTMPLHYRLGALWGGQAGSLLLWGWLLTVYGAVAVLGNRHQNRRLMPWVCVSLLANVGALRARLGLPVLVGPSRKAFLGELTGDAAAERDRATQAACAVAIFAGADAVRVHDVAGAARAAAVGLALRGARREAAP